MSLNKRIALLFDTNYLYIDEDKTTNPYEINFDTYHKFNKTLEFLRLNEKIEIFIPELVLYEKISHQKQKLKNQMPSIEDQTDYYSKLRKKYFYELSIIHIPFNKNMLFNDIFKMALDMKPPFSSDEEYDKGFKDSILILSLFEFAKYHHYDEYILVTNDKGFTENIESLQKLMKDYCSISCEIDEKSLNIIKNENFAKNFYKKYGLFSDLRKYLDETLIEEIEDNYSRTSNIITDYDYPIKYYDILYDQTRIYQIDENLYEVEIFISIAPDYIDDHIPYLGDDEKISQWESYYLEQIDEKWKHALNDFKYNIDYEPFIWDESFLNDEYP